MDIPWILSSLFMLFSISSRYTTCYVNDFEVCKKYFQQQQQQANRIISNNFPLATHNSVLDNDDDVVLTKLCTFLKSCALLCLFVRGGFSLHTVRVHTQTPHIQRQRGTKKIHLHMRNKNINGKRARYKHRVCQVRYVYVCLYVAGILICVAQSVCVCMCEGTVARQKPFFVQFIAYGWRDVSCSVGWWMESKAYINIEPNNIYVSHRRVLLRSSSYTRSSSSSCAGLKFVFKEILQAYNLVDRYLRDRRNQLL